MKTKTTSRLLLTATAAVLCVYVFTAHVHAAAFVNGSFEGASTNGWTVVQNSGGDAVGIGSTDGAYSYHFNGNFFFGNGILAQTFDTTSGKTYSVSFDFGSVGNDGGGYLQTLMTEVRDGNSASSGAELINPDSGGKIDGANTGFSLLQTGALLTVSDATSPLFSYSDPVPYSPLFSTVFFTFTALSGSSTLVFSDQTGSAGQYSDGLLDNVIVQQVAPEPASAALLLGGGALLALRRRRSAAGILTHPSIPHPNTNTATPMKTKTTSRLLLTASIGALASLLSAAGAYSDILYETNSWTSTVGKFDLSTGAYLGVVGSGLTAPTGLAFDSLGNLFVADEEYHIYKITPDGATSVFASIGIDSKGLAFDSQGNLYVANETSNTIQRFTPAGVGSLFADTGFPSGPSALAFDSTGNLLVANYINDTVEKFGADGTDLGLFARLGSYHDPDGLAIDGNGNVYVACLVTGRIEKFNSAGVDLGTFASLDSPVGLAFDSAGNLYAAQQNSNAIMKFSPDGVGTIFTSFTGTYFPQYIAIQPTPEPTSAALLLGGGALLALRRRRVSPV